MSVFYFIDNVHHALQFILIIEWDADLSFTLWRACHLHLHLEELRQTVSEDAELQWQLMHPYGCTSSSTFLTE